MRHLGSFLLALILAPVVYLLTGVGLSAFGQAAQRGVDERPLATVLALATLVVGGGVYAVLVMARLSPVGPALAGFFFLGMPAWPLVDPASYERLLQDLGARFELLGVEIVGIDLVGSSGLGVLIAVPLIATLASPRRWSRYDTSPAQVTYSGYPAAYPQGAYPPDAYADATRHATETGPVTEQLPDVAPPTLHYPKYAAPVAVPAAPAPAPATVVLAPQPASPPAAGPIPAASSASVPPSAAAPTAAPSSPAPAVPSAASSTPAAPAPSSASPASPPAAATPSAAPQPAAPAPTPPTAPTDRPADQEISVPRLDDTAEPKLAAPSERATSPDGTKPGEEPTVKIDPDTLKPI